MFTRGEASEPSWLKQLKAIRTTPPPPSAADSPKHGVRAAPETSPVSMSSPTDMVKNGELLLFNGNL